MPITEKQCEELQIGSIAILGGSAKIINRQSFKWAVCEWGGIDIDFIELTPEILTFLGFSDNTYGGFTISTDDEVDFSWIRIFFEHNEERKLVYDAAQMNDEYILGECKYLHQLQRFYEFASGKKLEVNIEELNKLLAHEVNG